VRKAIIVDLDGTLCNVDHRVIHLKLSPGNWKKFNDHMIDDTINHWCEVLIKSMKEAGYEILFVTGRGEDYREHTTDWLLRHQIQWDELYMRPQNDFREDNDIKEELYEKYIKNNFDVLFVVDDRLSVVKRWREMGLVCLQCAWGDF
jgi:FMN phosphatase YigB (HAD superfamily)